MNNYSPTRVSVEVTARVRGLVARHDIAQTDLARLCDVSQSQFSKILRGVRPMTLDQLIVISDALDIDLDQLFSDVSDFLEGRRHAHASPVRLVEEGERLDVGHSRAQESLDSWGENAHRRWFDRVVQLEDFRLAEHDDAQAAASEYSEDRGEDGGY